MISVPTVLVLGAGASVPYQFPTGATLLERLSQLGFQTRDEQQRDIRMSSAAARVHEARLADLWELHQFTERLANSGASSIDQFLAHQPAEVVATGKLVLATEIAWFERFHHLTANALRDQGPWYRHLWKQLDHRPDRLLENQLRVVTFNYDRSLEAFIANALRYMHDVPPERAAELAGAFPIVHVHGKLGNLSVSENDGRPFEPAITAEQIRRAAEGIRVLSELTPETEGREFHDARLHLGWAERIHFIGLSYDRDSLRRLGIHHDASLNAASIGGSVFGMTLAEIQRVSGYFPLHRFVASDPRHHALDYLRHARALDD